jgi:bifunctional non-homologous end joining protein LigD
MKTTAAARAPKTKTKLPVAISHPDKVFWPEEGYTKLNLAEYYAAIFPKLSSYVKDRILTLERCPDGMNGGCFYAKEIPPGMPADTPTKRIDTPQGKRKSVNFVVAGSLETQLALVNLGCIAVHVMAGRASAPRRSDWVCFDLDPESGKFADAARAALLVKESLDALNLDSFAKTSGSRGLHILIPLRNGPDASEVLDFAEKVVARVAAAHPKELTVEHSLAARRGRVYLDPFRNAFGQTVAAPYSVRRHAHASISTPLAWRDVSPELDPADFNLGNFLRRLRRVDPWADFFRNRQALTEAMRLIAKL